jgi:hypothetical protein
MIDGYAQQLGINMTGFKACENSNAAQLLVTASNTEADVTYGISGTSSLILDNPTVVLNCRYVVPALSASQLRNAFCLASPKWCQDNPAVGA